MRISHTACHPGKRVLIVLRDGTRFEDRFLTRNDREIVLASGRKVHKRHLRSFIVLASGHGRQPARENQ